MASRVTAPASLVSATASQAVTMAVRDGVMAVRVASMNTLVSSMTPVVCFIDTNDNTTFIQRNLDTQMRKFYFYSKTPIHL